LPNTNKTFGSRTYRSRFGTVGTVTVFSGPNA
jgi:hypothetical protein